MEESYKEIGFTPKEAITYLNKTKDKHDMNQTRAIMALGKYIEGDPLHSKLSEKVENQAIEIRRLLKQKEDKGNVLYLCDHRKCEKCGEHCKYTANVKHAVNFENKNGTYWEIDNKDKSHDMLLYNALFLACELIIKNSNNPYMTESELAANYIYKAKENMRKVLEDNQ